MHPKNHIKQHFTLLEFIIFPNISIFPPGQVVYSDQPCLTSKDRVVCQKYAIKFVQRYFKAYSKSFGEKG
jgi:hypothetical protein